MKTDNIIVKVWDSIVHGVDTVSSKMSLALDPILHWLDKRIDRPWILLFIIIAIIMTVHYIQLLIY